MPRIGVRLEAMRGISPIPAACGYQTIWLNRHLSAVSRSACRAPNGKYGRREQRHSTTLIYARIAISEPTKTT
uniref:Uncharacterized protein n=1 Tax=Trichogramma kaykai TaxID=54128 RepID=A0ABD2XJX8_9HYME